MTGASAGLAITRQAFLRESLSLSIESQWKMKSHRRVLSLAFTVLLALIGFIDVRTGWGSPPGYCMWFLWD